MKKTSVGETAESSVSHNPAIRKRVMLGDAEAPGLTNFSQAVLEAGQVARGHAHEDMYEIFFVRSGKGRIVIDEEEHALRAGTCLLIEPNEWHEISNAHEEDLVLIYFGLRSESGSG